VIVRDSATTAFSRLGALAVGRAAFHVNGLGQNRDVRSDSEITAGSGGEIPLRDSLRPSGPVRFGLRIDHGQDALIVRVEGELDALTTPKVNARLDGVLRTSATDLVLDLRRVQFMDSAGLQLLLHTRRRLVRTSRKLSVICGDGPVRQIIELARLADVLDVTSE
jgi:anti-anti-sigma factor